MRKQSSSGRNGALVTRKRIPIGKMLEQVRSQGNGAVVLFLGTVRGGNSTRAVRRMYYEAYVPMAESHILQIEKRVARRWPKVYIRIVHRIGFVDAGQIGVAVAASSPHRAEAFQACRYAVDKVKRGLPVWKKEFRSHTSNWVRGHRIEPI